MGSRFGERKQFKNLNGKPLWVHTIEPFLESDLIDEIIFIVEGSLVNVIQSSDSFKLINKKKEVNIAKGGPSRTDSVFNGIQISKKINDIVCIHDVARPFVKTSLIEKTIQYCENYDGSILAIPSMILSNM